MRSKQKQLARVKFEAVCEHASRAGPASQTIAIHGLIVVPKPCARKLSKAVRCVRNRLRKLLVRAPRQLKKPGGRMQQGVQLNSSLLSACRDVESLGRREPLSLRGQVFPLPPRKRSTEYSASLRQMRAHPEKCVSIQRYCLLIMMQCR